MTKPIWKGVPGIPGYEVSEQGEVRSYWTNAGKLTHMPRVLKGKQKPRGYMEYRLRTARSQSRYFLGHRLVALTFHGPPPFPGAQASHKNDIKWDNRPSNIEWASQNRNMRTAMANGRIARGQRVNTCKISPDAVFAIRSTYRTGDIGTRRLAKQFGISRSQVQNIVHHRSWKHLADPPMGQ